MGECQNGDCVGSIIFFSLTFFISFKLGCRQLEKFTDCIYDGGMEGICAGTWDRYGGTRGCHKDKRAAAKKAEEIEKAIIEPMPSWDGVTCPYIDYHKRKEPVECHYNDNDIEYSGFCKTNIQNGFVLCLPKYYCHNDDYILDGNYCTGCTPKEGFCTCGEGSCT